jgi:hypothetical protein
MNRSFWFCVLASLLAIVLLTPACQDYGFEELPSSVIREKRFTQTIAVASEVDILFVVDNSRSMVGEQKAIAESFASFTNRLDEKFGTGKYRIAVITTGMESDGCGPCPADQPNWYSCTNDTGENGRFQDRRGHNIGTIEEPEFDFIADPTCKVIETANLESCFYHPIEERGVIFAGINGCGYERGLEPIRVALQEPLINTWNGNFLRPNATLAVVVISDEEDCGAVGDVTENIQGVSGNACYYASKGQSPDGLFSDPVEGRPYQLTSVREYYDFLVELKGGRKSLVKFAAIVGITDREDPTATTIEYQSNQPSAAIRPACVTPNCVSASGYCDAMPGTRYVALAELFGIGENGFVDTICQENFSQTMGDLGTFVACPREFKLSEKILDPGLANILINSTAVPRYSCSGSSQNNVEECTGLGDTGCSAGSCVQTWRYIPPEDINPPDPAAPGGMISFADHYDPCRLIQEGEVNIELVYVTE